MKSSADSGPASCGVLAAFLGLAERCKALHLSLPDGLLPWHYSHPQYWKKRVIIVLLFALTFCISWPSHGVVHWFGLMQHAIPAK